MTIRKTLLQITQSILSSMDGQEVNSISDTDEALQVAEVVQDTFYNIVASRKFPEHTELLPLDSLGDSTRPTAMKFSSVVSSGAVSSDRLQFIEYNIATEAGETLWKRLAYCNPEDFLRRNVSVDGTNADTVTDIRTAATYQVFNDRMPSFWTSFDDEHIIMDAYDSSEEATLQSSKTRALAVVIPTFSLSDAYVPDIDDQFHPLLLAEAKSACLSLFNEGSDPKVEQAARRLKTSLQNDRFRNIQKPNRPHYGRKGRY